MLDPKKPRVCGICSKRRKVWGFALNTGRTYTADELDNTQKSVYTHILLEGQPRFCKQCTNEALVVLNRSMAEFLQRKMIDEKTQIYTV